MPYKIVIQKIEKDDLEQRFENEIHVRPICRNAQHFANLIQRPIIAQKELKIIQKLGFDITLKS